MLKLPPGRRSLVPVKPFARNSLTKALLSTCPGLSANCMNVHSFGYAVLDDFVGFILDADLFNQDCDVVLYRSLTLLVDIWGSSVANKNNHHVIYY